MFTKIIVAIILPYTLNLYSAVCQLYLNKMEEKKKKSHDPEIDPWKIEYLLISIYLIDPYLVLDSIFRDLENGFFVCKSCSSSLLFII